MIRNCGFISLNQVKGSKKSFFASGMIVAGKEIGVLSQTVLVLTYDVFFLHFNALNINFFKLELGSRAVF